MRSSGRLLVVGAILGVVASSAVAPAAEPPPADNPRAARAVATWRKLGARRAGVVARAFCSLADRPVRQAAEQELRALGVAAVEPLLGQDGPGCSVGMLASEILCRSSPFDRDAVRPLFTRLGAIAAGPRGGPADGLWAALSFIYRPLRDPYPPPVCPNRPELSQAIVAALLTPETVARIAPDYRRWFTDISSALVQSLGERPAGYVPTLARWLDEPFEVSYGAVKALASFGPAAAPAVPSLKSYLVQQLEHARKPGTDRFATAPLAPIAETTASIGPAAKPMVDELRRALEFCAGNICHDDSDDAGAMVGALGAIDASTWPVIRGTVEAAWKKAASCGGQGQDRLMIGVGSFGPAAISFDGFLRPVLVDARASFESRGQAARALRRLGARLEAREAALARLLEARLARQERDTPVERSRRDARPPENAAGMAAIEALAACREDAGVATGSTASIDEMNAFGYDENRHFSACVAVRVCGPGATVAAETLGVCCDYAYLRARPRLCPRD